MMRVFLSILTAWAVFHLPPTLAQAQAQAPAQAQEPITNETCKTCHVPHEEHKVNAYHSDCLTCHTPEPKHVVEGGKGTVKFPTADNCLSCHKNNDHKRMNWAFSPHKKAGVECNNCHGNHSQEVHLKDGQEFKGLNVGMWKSDRNSAVCMSCHKDVAARMNMPSHHPVKEGGLSCVNCHDPHTGKQTTLAGKTEQCTQCHQNVRGPKVFEHAPVVEDCTTCHNPHGSPNRRLMQLAQPMQCLQCHSIAATRHTKAGTPNGAQMRNCTNCHSAIHGSHSDPKLKY
ncbi:MAG TPA: cytochrome c3 family protein [Thiobacillus sp.]|nr:cytochrome c3 family protein [Thiobacillus sp.]